MHVHTKEGSLCSKVSVFNTIELLKKKGFDGVLLTDHESILGYQKYMSESDAHDGFVVLKGFEYNSAYGDLIIILPSDEVFENVGMSTEAVIEKVHLKNGVVGIPHMFRDRLSVGNNAGDYTALERIVQLVDFIEVYNGKATEEQNETAQWFAKQYFKFETSGSDSHTSKGVGKAYTIFEGVIKTELDLINYIKKSKI